MDNLSYYTVSIGWIDCEYDYHYLGISYFGFGELSIDSHSHQLVII